MTREQPSGRAVLGQAAGDRPDRTWWLVQAAVLAISVALRFCRLCDLPVGLHYDESVNGLDATSILTSPIRDWPIFLTANYGREPLHAYLMAASQALLGPGIAALRSVAAAVTVAIGPALSWLAWEMAPALGLDRKRLSLWAAATPLTLLLNEIMSRYATRNMHMALLEILLLAALWRAWRTGKTRWWFAAGVFGGLCLYTYLPARLLPLLMATMLAAALVKQRRWLQEQAANVVLGLAVAGAIVAPLAWYLVRHPWYILNRTSQVSVFVGNWPLTIAKNALAVLGMAFVTGDGNLRDNVPGRPLFDAIMAAFFVVGMAWLALRLRRGSSLLLLAWLGTMLLPTILSDNAPHFLRAIGAMPAFALIAAVGIEAIVTQAGRLRRTLVPWLMGVGWLGLAASTLITWHVFSTVWAVNPALYYARDAGLFAVAAALRAELVPGTEAGTIYMSPSGWDHPTTKYGLVGADPPVTLTGFDGRVCVRVPQGAARYLILSREDFRGLDLLRTYLPDSTAHTIVVGPDGETVAVELEQPAAGRIVYPEMSAYAATLADGIRLDGYWLSTPQLRPGDRLYVRLQWHAEATPTGRYTAFAHLLAVGPDGAMQQLAGSDAEPGKGTCSTDGWLPGETIVDEMELAVPNVLDPAGDHWIAVGLYNLADGRRVAIEGHANDEVLLGPVAVAASG